MTFVTPLLLAGSLLIAVPVLLHLIMRRQPQRLEFPALQFIRQRQQANRRRLNLRHWLLLALRCALIAGLAFALARPTLKGSGLQSKEGAPLAVALVIDNSLRMQYVHRNQTRQEVAIEFAQSLVSKLPEGTQAAVLDRSRGSSGFVDSLPTAEARLRGINPAGNVRPLRDIVRDAIQLVAEREEYRQEVFVFTDLSIADWDEQSQDSLNKLLQENADVKLYLVNIGAERTSNQALLPLELRQATIRSGEPLHIRVPIAVTGLSEAPLLELYLLDSTGQPVKRGQQIVSPSEEGRGEAVFEIGGLSLGTHQGYVSLPASDPLGVDNTRYFTVEVQRPAEVLLLAERKRDAVFLREALQPSLDDDSAVRFRCEIQRYSEATSVQLSEFDAVCLLDPPALSDPLWQALGDYVEQGGGLGIFLGHRARPSAFNQEAAQRLLPGNLKLRSRYATYLRPRGLDHPALSGLRDYAETVPWQIYPVWQFWEFGDLAGDTYVVARYHNERPALLERTFGQGRVLTLSTPISDPLEPKGREPWNLLPTGPEPWPFLALSNQIVGYLAQHGNDQLTFRSGETVNLQLSTDEQVSTYVLREPDGESLRRTLPPGEKAIRISTTDKLGNYRISSGGQSRQLDMGFSINATEEISVLEQVDPAELAKSLPKDQVELATNLRNVEEYVAVGPPSRELFPWLIALVALVWGTEHVLANRFYREAP